MLSLLSALAIAQTRQIERYIYDDAGNLIRIEVETIEGPPQIDALEPDTLLAGSTRNITATGERLDGVDITTDTVAMTVANVSGSATEISFDLTAAPDTVAGAHTLSFDNGSGTTDATVQVREPLPALSLQPAPVVASLSQPNVPLSLTLAEPAATTRTLDLAVADTSVADVAPTTVEIAAGTRMPSITPVVTAAALGSTTFNVGVEGVDVAATSVFVGQDFDPSLTGDRFFSAEVGVTKRLDTPRTLTRGPLTDLVEVLKGATTTDADRERRSFLVGVALGTVISDVTPASLTVGDSTTLVLSGQSLGGVTDVELEPDSGLTLSGLTVSSDQVSLELAVSADASPEPRRIRVIADTGSVPFIDVFDRTLRLSAP